MPTFFYHPSPSLAYAVEPGSRKPPEERGAAAKNGCKPWTRSCMATPLSKRGNATKRSPREAVSAGPFAAGDGDQRKGSPPPAEPVLTIQQPKQKTANARVLLQQYNQVQATGLSLLNGAAVLPFVRWMVYFPTSWNARCFFLKKIWFFFLWALRKYTVSFSDKKIFCYLIINVHGIQR